MKKLLYFLLINSVWLGSCSSSKQINKQTKPAVSNESNFIASEAQKIILEDNNFLPAHVGISIFDPSTNTYLYNYQGDKYFVPASNTKLFTCYAAMKNLGDSLRALDYFTNDTAIWIRPTADPTLLQSEFKYQPVYKLLTENRSKKIYYRYPSSIASYDILKPFGKGWAWDDYNDSYMVERNEMPLYGNLVHFYFVDSQLNMLPKFKIENFWKGGFPKQAIQIKRDWNTNTFSGYGEFGSQYVPFKTSTNIVLQLLGDTLKQKVSANEAGDLSYMFPDKFQVIHSQPTDSLLKITMHRSDNFFAEQTLLMVSNERIGVMNDRAIIDTLLSTDFKDLPQKAKWVDGSGLSRYNLITPQDFVWILTQMKHEFTWERITTILPTGNDGTLAGYYKNYAGKIYAKTGTLSNNVALSGFITTNKGKQLIFSILVNNHQTSASNIRRTVEKFLTEIMEKY